MSQYQLIGYTAKGPVTVRIGWNRQWKFFFMMIEPDQEPPMYSHFYEVAPYVLNLKYYQRVLERFGITNISLKEGHPCGMYETLMSDRQKSRARS
jgi:hypothetical protein